MTAVVLAYGSNLHPYRLQDRCSSARLIGTTSLAGRRPEFHKRGQDGSAKCNACRTDRPEDVLWVAGFELSESDQERLNRFEGLGRGYHLTSVQIDVGRGSSLAVLYEADDDAIDDDLHPFDWYSRMVVLGARYHGFPEDYIHRLGSVRTVEDPDETRAQRQWSIIEEMTKRLP